MTQGKQEHILTTEQIVKLGRELNQTKTSSDLAMEFNVPKSVIMSVAHRLRHKYGIQIPVRRYSIRYDAAAIILKQDSKNFNRLNHIHKTN